MQQGEKRDYFDKYKVLENYILFSKNFENNSKTYRKLC